MASEGAGMLGAEHDIVTVLATPTTTDADLAGELSSLATSAVPTAEQQQRDAKKQKAKEKKARARELKAARMVKKAQSEVGGEPWEKQFEKIQEYKARFGNTRVPAVLDTPRFPRLGAWVAAQRMAHRQWRARAANATDLTEQQVITQQRLKKLEEIGFEFSGIAKKVWDEKFELLQQFKEEFGHTRVPQRKLVEGYPKLGRWVSRQREAYRNLQIQQQEEERKRVAAEEAAAAAAAAAAADGGEGAEAHESTAADAQAKEKANTRKVITQERIARLNSIGFEWQLKAPKRNLTPEQRLELRAARAPKGQTWEAKFKLLLAYIEEHGDARVPCTLDTEKFPKLGGWVARQRKAYRCEKRRENGEIVPGPHKISQVRIARLEAAGFEWTDLKRSAWEDKVGLLRDYIQEFGHTRVPATLDTPKYPKLGSWVKSQRKGYRNEQLLAANGQPKSKERLQVWQIAMLESIGFEWKGLQASAWESKFALLQQYVREKGNARVPATLNTARYPGLGVWVRTQRKAYRNKVMRPYADKDDSIRSKGMHKISDLQVAKLQGLGFEWVVGKVRGLDKLAQQEAAQMGQLLPQHGGHHGLGGLAGNPHQHMVGHPYMVASNAELMQAAAAHAPRQPTAWDRKFQLLQQYVREFGNTRVPENLDTARYPRLGAWVQAQRRARRNERLRAASQDKGAAALGAGGHARRITSLQIIKLDRIGFEWGSAKQSGWDAKFALLQQFVLEHGNARVPRSLDTPQYPKLGNWVSHQRQAYRNEKIRAAGGEPRQTQVISSAQIAKMEALGFEWSGLRKWDWEAKFALLRQYIAEHGHARVPQGFDTPQYPKLGSWVQAQRQAYRSEKVRQRRLQEQEAEAKNAAANAAAAAATAGDNEAGIATATPVTAHSANDPGGAAVATPLTAEAAAEAAAAGGAVATATAAAELEDLEDDDLDHHHHHHHHHGLGGPRKRKRPGTGTTTSRLTALQIAKLENVGFEWKGAKQQAWEANWALLRDFVMEHGHARVPQRLDSDKYPKLGRWVSRQREAYRNMKMHGSGVSPKGTQKISQWQIRRLESLQIDWIVPRVKKPKPNPLDVQRKPKKVKMPTPAWEKNFELLKAYKEQYGDTRVPQRREVPGFPKLGRWVSRQREAYRNEKLRAMGREPKGSNKISPIQIELLRSIGMEWSVPKTGSSAHSGGGKRKAPSSSSSSSSSSSGGGGGGGGAAAVTAVAKKANIEGDAVAASVAEAAEAVAAAAVAEAVAAAAAEVAAAAAAASEAAPATTAVTAVPAVPDAGAHDSGGGDVGLVDVGHHGGDGGLGDGGNIA